MMRITNNDVAILESMAKDLEKMGEELKQYGILSYGYSMQAKAKTIKAILGIDTI